MFGLDAGSGNTECYSYFTEAVAKAVGTLGDEQEYCVVLWKDGGPERFPSSGWANKSGLTGVQKGMDIGPNGVAEPLSSMKYCVSVGGDQTILVTAKTDLTADMAGAVVAARKEGQQIDTVGVVGNIDSVAPDSALKAIADKAGGTYLPVDVNRLRELLHPVN